MKTATISGSISPRFHPIVIPTTLGLILILVPVLAQTGTTQEGTVLTGTISGFDRGRTIKSTPLPAAKRDPLIRIPEFHIIISRALPLDI